MTLFVKGVVLLAAALFIGVSASMNAVFLSSFGRTPLETGLLIGVSLAGDGVKAVLPVVVMRALGLRAWGHAVMASVMLAVVMAMSLGSGVGFAALTRGSAIGARETQAGVLAAREKDLAGIDRRLARLPDTRSAARIEADLDALKLERGWLASKACTEALTPGLRQFCGSLFGLRAELATATERDGLLADRHRLRAEVERLRGSGAGTDGDPQATALAELLGTDRNVPRLVLTTGMAVVLELGSLVLILLAAGPAIIGWREPGSEPPPPLVPATLPRSVDRAHWRRQRKFDNLSLDRGSGDGR
jgi:hypothetical protein